jgi:hypothetical protein
MAKITWNEADFKWNNNDYLWHLVEIVDDVIEDIIYGGKSKKRREDEKKKWEEKQKKVIRLVMYRKNIKIYDEKKEIKKIDTHIEDIKLIAEELKKHVQIIHG